MLQQYPINIIHHQDCLQGLKRYPDQFFNCCVTSPPYWKLRDYQVEAQIGQEIRPESFIEKLVEVFREVMRVLDDRGTLWINIGDSYYTGPRHKKRILKNKEVIGIPWMLAFALRKIGFWVRQEIIWHKPNPMPEGVKDRCTRSHEYIFMFTKSSEYYYNSKSVNQYLKTVSIKRMMRGKSSKNKYANGIPGQKPQKINQPRINKRKKAEQTPQPGIEGNRAHQSTGDISTVPLANLRSVWTIAAKGYKGVHYATYPLQIPYRCISAGCRENGIVLDPFMGSGTTAIAAGKLQRNYVGFEINPEYVKMAQLRLHQELGLFK